jgi:hypothetical protein
MFITFILQAAVELAPHDLCLRYPRMQVSYITGGKYCRNCEYYFFTERLFCEYCGMRLRASPANREFKEKFRARKKLNAVAGLGGD